MNLPNGGDKQVINDGNNAPNSHHHFNLSYKVAQTERFGECNPFVFMYGVPDDKNVTFRCGNELRTTALASPLLQNLRKNLDYYVIRSRAILPHCWDFFNNNPVIGGDINPNLVNCLIYLSGEADSLSGVKDLVSAVFHSGGVVSAEASLESFKIVDWDKFVRLLIVMETFFSRDSLFAAFRMPLHKRIGIQNAKYVKQTLQQAWFFYHKFLLQLSDSVPSFQVKFLDSNSQELFTRTYEIAKLSERMRLYYDLLECPYVNWFGLSDLLAQSVYTSIDTAVDLPNSCGWLDRSLGFLETISTWMNSTKSIDIRPIIAYQLICAEYQTNDKIDYVYSADMLRKVYEGYFLYICESRGNSSGNFHLNGSIYPYDAFSAYALSTLLGTSVREFSFASTNWYAFSLVINLFTRKRSLRYVDYFTGARSHALAVGDVNVTVSGNAVSAIDMSKGIQSARYLLAVNRVGPKAKQYVRGIFNGDISSQPDTPVKIGHIDSVVYGIETQNTGEAQLESAQTITTNLTSRSEDFAFQIDLEEDSMLIGISSYEIARFYTEGWSKFADKVDRFDHFNPYFQFTGDQPIKQTELQAGLDSDAIFGYQSKDMEYKLMTDYALLPEELRGWIFAQDDIKDNIEISPDFIRAHQSELDRYFLAMTADNAADRYHFICLYNNKIDASRNMLFDPQILK